MPFAAMLLILAALMPLLACLTLAILGKRLGTPLAGYVAIFFIGISFLCSGWGMLRWVLGGTYHGQPFGKSSAPISLTCPWIPIGSQSAPHGLLLDHAGWLDAGIYIDSLTLALFVTVTLAALVAHIFAVRSLRRDPKFSRFFTCLSLCCFAMLALLLSGTLLQMALFLELLGVGASLLIAFRSDRPTPLRSGARMFLVQRVGDLGFVLGLGVLMLYVGNLSLPELWLMLGNGAVARRVILPNGGLFPPALLTAAGVGLFIAAAARCAAQFPLHVWTGDAADGVAPAAAIVMAVTLAPAGVYFMARVFPLFTPSARLLIAIVGTVTLAMAALIACVQSDSKKVLVFLTMSQLGYMVLGIGVGSWSGAMFHLVACAFFLVLLFLAAGAVIRAARGQTRLWQFGGLAPRMPVTAVTSAVACLAVCGVGWGTVGLSGYFSRGLILRHAAAFAALAAASHRNSAYWAIFVVPLASTLAVCFAATRWWTLTFVGRSRNRRLFDHAREVSTLFWPLVVLAIMTLLAGNWLGIRDMLESSVFESRQGVAIEAQGNPALAAAAPRAFAGAWPADDQNNEDEEHRDDSTVPLTPAAASLARGRALMTRWSWPPMAVGILAGLLLYLPGDRLARRWTARAPLRWLYLWLSHRMYFDELYEALFVNVILAAAGGLAWLDRRVFGAGLDAFDVPPAAPSADPGTPSTARDAI